MNDLLFDAPFWMPVVLALVGIVVLWNGSSRQKTKLRNVGLGLWLLAIGWFAMGYFVDTDKEKVTKNTRQLVSAVVKGEWDSFGSMLAPEIRFGAQGEEASAVGKESVVEAAKSGATAIGLQGASVQSPEVNQTGPYITVATDIYSSQSGMGMPPTIRSSFVFEWEQSTSGWVVREIRLVQIGDSSAKDLKQAIGFTKRK